MGFKKPNFVFGRGAKKNSEDCLKARKESAAVRGVIQKLVDKLNIFFMHYGILPKLHILNIHNLSTYK